MFYEGLLTALQPFSWSSILTLIIIFSLAFFFSSQIWAWITPPKFKPLHAMAVGTVAGALIVFITYTSIPLAPALLNASIVGVYGYWGYAWVLSMIWIVGIFGINTWNSWAQNKPLEVIQ